MIRLISAFAGLILLLALVLLLPAVSLLAQQSGCRTSALTGQAISNYCASEAYVSRHFPVSATTGHVATFADSSGQVLQDGGAAGTSIAIGSTPITSGAANCTLYDEAGMVGCTLGVLLNKNKSISGNYPIAPGDEALTLNWTGSPGTITLPAVTGFDSRASIRICNDNANDASHHAATLSGFPAPSLQHLWMGQCEAVAIENGVWIVTEFPGLFLPAVTPTCYADTGGARTNDGLVSNAAANAVDDPLQCVHIFQQEMNTRGAQPVICLTGGETYNQATGGDRHLYMALPSLIVIVNNCTGGAAAVLRTTAGTVVAQIDDFGGYFVFGLNGNAITLDCTGALSHPCYGMYHHQQGGTDFYGSFTIIGGDFTDYGIYADSIAKTNVNSTITFQGHFLQLVSWNLGAMMDINNGVTIANSTGIAGKTFQFSQNSTLQWSGTLTFGTGTSDGTDLFYTTNNANILLASNFAVSGTIGGSPFSYTALNNAVFCNASTTAAPGGAGRTTATGYAAGAAVASSGGCLP